MRFSRSGCAAGLALVAACSTYRAQKPNDALHIPRTGHTQSFARYGSGSKPGDQSVRLSRPIEPIAARTEELEYLRHLVELWWVAEQEHVEKDGVSIATTFGSLRERAGKAETDAAWAATLREELCRLGDGHLRLDQSVATTAWSSGLRFVQVAEGAAVAEVDAARWKGRQVKPKPGDLLLEVDGRPLGTWWSDKCLRPGSTPAHRTEMALASIGRQSRFNAEKPSPKKISLRGKNGKTYEVELPWATPDPATKTEPCVRVEKLAPDVMRVVLPTFACGADGVPNTAEYARQLKDAAKALAGAKHVVIDVRQNGGGDDAQARLAAALFLDGIVDWMRFRHGGPYSTMKAPASETFDPAKVRVAGPIPAKRWLLVGPGCMSTCEIFVAALRYRSGTTLVGTTTAGSVGNPTSFRLPYSGWSVQIPITRYELLGGEAPIEAHGISPDVDVRATQDDIRAGRDPVVQATLTRIRGKE